MNEGRTHLLDYFTSSRLKVSSGQTDRLLNEPPRGSERRSSPTDQLCSGASAVVCQRDWKRGVPVLPAALDHSRCQLLDRLGIHRRQQQRFGWASEARAQEAPWRSGKFRWCRSRSFCVDGSVATPAAHGTRCRGLRTTVRRTHETITGRWRKLLQEEPQIKGWIDDGLTVVKISILLRRKGIEVSHRTLARSRSGARRVGQAQDDGARRRPASGKPGSSASCHTRGGTSSPARTSGTSPMCAHEQRPGAPRRPAGTSTARPTYGVRSSPYFTNTATVPSGRSSIPALNGVARVAPTGRIPMSGCHIGCRVPAEDLEMPLVPLRPRQR